VVSSNYVYLPENSEISEPALKDRESESASEGVAYRDLMDLMLDKAESESVSNDIPSKNEKEQVFQRLL
jgi:hypothetical protein